MPAVLHALLLAVSLTTLPYLYLTLSMRRAADKNLTPSISEGAFLLSAGLFFFGKLIRCEG